jgi:hypothetical protein
VSVPTPAVDSVTPNPPSGEQQQSAAISAEDLTLLSSFFDDEMREKVIKMYEKMLANPDGKPSTFGSLSFGPITDRQVRTNIHTVGHSMTDKMNFPTNG